MVEKGGVFVKTAKIGPKGTPVATEIRLKVRYGLTEEKYFYLTHLSPKKAWWEIKSVAFLISRSISNKGIEKRDFLKPFEDRTTGVDASLARAQVKITERLFELYGTTFVEIQNDVIGNIT